MHFGCAAVLALLLGGSAASGEKRQKAHLWVGAGSRPTPLSLAPAAPVDLRSLKIVGASGVGAFLPLVADVALGAGFTTLRTAPDQRAMQIVAALRLRF